MKSDICQDRNCVNDFGVDEPLTLKLSSVW